MDTKNERLRVLNPTEIKQKTLRIAHELHEHFFEDEVVLVGIADRGYLFAEQLHKHLNEISNIKSELVKITIAKDAPLSTEPILSKEGTTFKDKIVVVTDDVLNSGNTLIHACSYLLQFEPKEMTTAVLIDRRHRRYPVRADFVGLTLSTTLEDHIKVDFDDYEAFII